MEGEKITFGEAASRLGLQWWQLDRLAKHKLIRFERAGYIRLIYVSDLALIREAAEQRGYHPHADREKVGHATR